jgi:hypothetical protein
MKKNKICSVIALLAFISTINAQEWDDPITTTNWNEIWKNSFIQSETALNAPEPTGWFWGLNMNHSENSSTYKYNGQIAIKNYSSNPTMYFRSTNSNGSGTWAKLLTDHGNQLINGKLEVKGSVETAREGFAGTYNSTEVQGIWSIGSNWGINTSSNDFGNQYGIVYAHPNAGSSGPKKPIIGWEHQILFTHDGNKTAAISLTHGHAYFAGNVGIGTTFPATKLNLNGNESPKPLGTSTECAIKINNEYANTFGANTEIQFGISTGITAAVIAAKYTSSGNGKAGSDLIFGTQSTLPNEVGVIERMRITHDGNIGIGTTNPSAKLDVEGRIEAAREGFAGTYNSTEVQGIWSIGSGFGINTASNDFGDQYGIVYAHTNAGSSGSKKPIADWGHQILFTEAGDKKAAISLTHGHAYFAGKVGIGTTKVADDYKLSVGGNIRAEHIEVSAPSGWADFVFDADYELNTLSQVEKYIAKNKHLPNVPSTKEVEEKGVNLGEMDAVLLRKVEELTLYIIELQKQIDVLKIEN